MQTSFAINRLNLTFISRVTDLKGHLKKLDESIEFEIAKRFVFINDRIRELEAKSAVMTPSLSETSLSEVFVSVTFVSTTV